MYAKLLRQPAKASRVDSEKDETLELRAAIIGEQLAIIFRKNISGITQRLGEIILVKDEAQEVDAIAWASTAILRCDDLEKEVEELKRKYEQQRTTTQDLQQQLEDLIEAKKQHENALLEKFRDILNAKKLKIRDQQRLLGESKAGVQKGIVGKNQRGLSDRNTTNDGFGSRSRAEQATQDPPQESPSYNDPKTKSQRHASRRLGIPDRLRQRRKCQGGSCEAGRRRTSPRHSRALRCVGDCNGRR